ncbi:type II toxin-antitoxin system tRNA(fMet)-specific endonuclease VapC [Vreelandella olivaria]|uniref:type II toxin-antitoxin system tRNA(fMet)-specific endonuclease VapC n=1 Tax=Vreelandella olivaria TaxID=390919 RepID=UPI00201FA794|nr:tRNA(fMet)-specific endonuclease VapC [Halomonas olivaria]
MLKFMLDTNICIFTIKNRPQKVRETFKQHHGQMCISSMTLMELIYGAEKSDFPERNLATVEGFAARLEILEYGNMAASHTGQLRAEQAKAGKPIGPYDQMIAGHARSQGLILVTNNSREFKRVPGLRVEDWVSSPAEKSSAGS